MMGAGATGTVQCRGRILANAPIAAGLIRLDLDLPLPVPDRPGQFAMLNLGGPGPLVFSRPLSLLAADGSRVSFLYKVVGRGTAALADLEPGRSLDFLGPLGTPFPADLPADRVVLAAGGVGLPPLHAWLRRFGGPDGVVPCFGARTADEVPWDLLADRWLVGVQDPACTDPRAKAGLVTDIIDGLPDTTPGAGGTVLLACGPLPMLKACRDLALRRGWGCWVSLEEHMGCGYGVCKGCVVPVKPGPAASSDAAGWRNATCCQEGPVFAAEDLLWTRLVPGPTLHPE